MSGDLAFDLHLLVARLDRAADELLVAAVGLSYRRFLTLLIVGELGNPTQRALAEALDVSEPSASRMTAVLAESGHLEVVTVPGGGNRRRLALTPAGKEAVERSREVLEDRTAGLLARARVPYAAYARHTRNLVRALDERPVTS